MTDIRNRSASGTSPDEPARNSAGELFLRSVIDIPREIHEGDFVVDLSAGFDEMDDLVGKYVVTGQLRAAFGDALALIRSAVREDKSRAAYLHGSFGSGKSHFMAVLAALLECRAAVRNKPALQELIHEHDTWISDRRFLMVPFHLPGNESLDAAVLGGYAKFIREHFPDAPPPLVHPDDLMLKDAATLRATVGDPKFLELLGLPDGTDVVDADGYAGAPAFDLDHAFAAAPGDAARRELVEHLLAGPLKSYSSAVMGDRQSYLPLENGLAEISAHAKSLGFDAVILFLDELILWLMGRTASQEFVQSEASKLVKLVESGDTRRPIPIVSLISRQRDIATLLHKTAVGAQEENLRRSIEHNSSRFGVINLEDSNFPAIARERVLRPLSEDARSILEAEFRKVESVRSEVWDTLLDQHGATNADHDDFRTAYPFSPALLNTLVVLAGALQRQRTGIKILQEMLHRRRAELTVGQLIPIGDLWDVLADGLVETFSDHLKQEFDNAVSFHGRVRKYLKDQYGSAEHKDYVATDRIVKTLLLAALAPEVPALTRLTGSRLAALNHGTFRSPIPGNEGNLVVSRLRQLAGHFGELRTDDNTRDPAFTLHLTTLDADPVLERVSSQDTIGERRNWVQSQLWKLLGVKETNQFWGEREVIWRGSRRTAEFILGNVRDPQELRSDLFEPSLEGRIRIVLDYPFDEGDYGTAQDLTRIRDLKSDDKERNSVVWLASHFSEARFNDLGRLVKVSYLLERNRLDDHASYLTTDDRARLRNQLEGSRSNLIEVLGNALRQAYGLVTADEANVSTPLDRHVHSLLSAHQARLLFAESFSANALHLADGLYDVVYPKHPDFDEGPYDRVRHAVTGAEVRTAWSWIQRAAEAGEPPRVEVEKLQLNTVRRIVNPLGLGEVTEGPLVLTKKWQQEIDRRANARPHPTEDVSVADIYHWLDAAGLKGLDRSLCNLVIATYALLADRAWVRYNQVVDMPPLDQIGNYDYALRAQDTPSASQFEIALHRGQLVFDVKDVPTFPSARNTRRLAEKVREAVTQHHKVLPGLTAMLEEHGGDLGIDVTSDRIVTAKAAERLVGRLRDIDGDTALVRALAAPDAIPDGVSETALCAAVGSAGEVLNGLRSLGGRAWSQLNTLRVLAERDGDLGRGAREALDELREEARYSEFARKLVPAVARALDQALELSNRALSEDAAARGAGRQPEPFAPGLGPTAGTAEAGQRETAQVVPDDADTDTLGRAEGTSAEGISPVRSTTGTGHSSTRRLSGARVPTDLAAQLGAIRAEIAALVAAEPGVDIEISWRALPAAAEGAGRGGEESEGSR